MKLHKTEISALKIIKLVTKMKYKYIGLRAGFAITITYC